MRGPPVRFATVPSWPRSSGGRSPRSRRRRSPASAVQYLGSGPEADSIIGGRIPEGHWATELKIDPKLLVGGAQAFLGQGTPRRQPVTIEYEVDDLADDAEEWTNGVRHPP
jgi:hypothetical protein